MFKLRPYQETAKRDIRALFRKGLKRIILCMPTGAGKTVTFADMIREALSNSKTAMILCDRKELISQAFNKVNALGLMPTIIAPGHPQTKNNIYLASVDTLVRRNLPEIDFLIIDEAHKQRFDNTIDKYVDFCDPYIIGATATPVRTGSQNSLDERYQGIVEPVTISELIEQGYLIPPKTYAAKVDFSSVGKKGNDYDTGQLFNKFNSTELYDGVIENYRRFANGKKALVFNVNVEHSKLMVERFKAEGIRAEHVDGTTPQRERIEKLWLFKTGAIDVLSNCSVLTTGYDEPSIDCIIINRATMSLALFLQMAGRGGRIWNKTVDEFDPNIHTAQDNFILIDQGANVYRHGLWQEDRSWSLEKKKKRDGDGVAPVKACESCGEINFASARVCCSCGHEFEIKEKKLKKAEFVEVKNVNRGARRSFNSMTATKQELKDYAEKMGYKPAWVYVQIKNQKKMQK